MAIKAQGFTVWADENGNYVICEPAPGTLVGRMVATHPMELETVAATVLQSLFAAGFRWQ